MSELRPLRRIRKVACRVLCVAVVWAVCGLSQAAEPATKPALKPATRPATRPAAESTTKPAVKRTTKPTTRPASPLGFKPLGRGGDDMTGLMWRMAASGLVVLLIGAVALFVVKRLLPKIRQNSHRRISVLETVYLGSRKAVHLLQVGSVKLLVASSPEGVVRLEDVTRGFPAEYADVAMRVQAETDAAEGSDGPREEDSNA